ncbi:hypothetical protein DE146DRAFT_162217 [Phaeosphaeria sp. MPI-PUGE-AT-0046c]|nr:hypothetical protein DE146DRAFT_162217 [Phaeosphaeria sp. MPI-PUGE-AT-0046c]
MCGFAALRTPGLARCLLAAVALPAAGPNCVYFMVELRHLQAVPTDRLCRAGRYKLFFICSSDPRHTAAVPKCRVSHFHYISRPRSRFAVDNRSTAIVIRDRGCRGGYTYRNNQSECCIASLYIFGMSIPDGSRLNNYCTSQNRDWTNFSLQLPQPFSTRLNLT